MQDSEEIFHYVSSSPIPVFPNDVLGIVTRFTCESRLQSLFIDDGPGSTEQYYQIIRSCGEQDLLSLNIEGGAVNDEDVPLVTVEMSNYTIS